MSLPASGADLLRLPGKTAGSPRRAYLHYKQYQMTRSSRSAYFGYLLQSAPAPEGIRLIHQLDPRSVFHTPRVEPRCGFAVSMRSSSGPEIRF
jgi:hypothetical protein